MPFIQLIVRDVTDVKVDQLSGRDPERLLTPRYTFVRAVNADQEEGMVPLISDRARIRLLSLDRAEIASGREPVRQPAAPEGVPETAMVTTPPPLHAILAQDELQGSPEPTQVAMGLEVHPARLEL